MQFETWEFEYGERYMLCTPGDEHARQRDIAEGGKCVRTFEADDWEKAKRMQNAYVSEIRRKLLKFPPTSQS